MSRKQQFYVTYLIVDLRAPGIGMLDMLRYDRCTPYEEKDAHQLARRLDDPMADGTPEQRLMVFQRVSLADTEPQYTRWSSFGCDIVAVADYPHQVDTRMAEALTLARRDMRKKSQEESDATPS